VAGVLVLLGAVYGFTRGGPGAKLGEAAEKVTRESSRARFDVSVDAGFDGSASYSGESVTAAGGTKARLEGTFTLRRGEPTPMTILRIGDDRWTRSPSVRLPQGKRWVHTTRADLAPQPMGPLELADFLRGAGQLEALGTESAVGASTTHYQGTVDVNTLAKETDGRTADLLGAALSGRVPLDVWLAKDGRPKLLRIEPPLESGSVRVEVEMVEYGVPVDVRPPPPEQVIDDSVLRGTSTS
jgi:LppX_LprAFG lipoprotein